MTLEEAQQLEQTLRDELAQAPTLWFIGVVQVTDNGADSRDPHRWSVQLLDVKDADQPIYVRSLGHWRAEIKPELQALAAQYY